MKLKTSGITYLTAMLKSQTRRSQSAAGLKQQDKYHLLDFNVNVNRCETWPQATTTTNVHGLAISIPVEIFTINVLLRSLPVFTVLGNYGE